RIQPHGFRDDGRIELVALYACRDKELPVAILQAFDLPLDRRSHRFGYFAFDVGDRARRYPTALRPCDGAAIPQVTQRVHHEEWTAFGLHVDQGHELHGKRVLRKLEREITLHIRPGQELERQLAQHTCGLEIGSNPQVRVPGDQHLGWPVCHEEHHSL